MHYLLHYKYIDDFVEKRKPFREKHLKLAKSAFAKGDMTMAGVFNDPPDAALLIFKGDDSSVVDNFVKNDPYVKNGIVTQWKIKEWKVALGG